MSLIKFFTKKEEPIDTPTYADKVKAMLDMVTSDLKLGMMTDKEYEDLCRTINDGALAQAETKLKELEEKINEMS